MIPGCNHQMDDHSLIHIEITFSGITYTGTRGVIFGSTRGTKCVCIKLLNRRMTDIFQFKNSADDLLLKEEKNDHTVKKNNCLGNHA